MKKKNRLDRVLLIVLIAALIAVAAVIVYKQFEYKASEDFYTGLLGGEEAARNPAQTFVQAPEYIVTKLPSQQTENTATPQPSATAEPSATPLPTLPPLTDEQAEEIVLALFNAAAGTDTKTERAVREQIEAEIRAAAVTASPDASAQRTEQPSAEPSVQPTALEPTEKPLTVKQQIELALDARNAQLQLYRSMTRPYLLEALAPARQEIEVTPTPSPSPSTDPSAEAVIEYTVEDGFDALSENEFGQAYLTLLEPLGGTDMESCLYLTKQVCELWFQQVDHEKLSWMNEDYLFWIYAPNTYIDYPVVQSENNSEYLKKMFNGQYNSAGTLFIDYRNLTDFRDPNTLIYGHNMRNNSMFGALTEYEDQAYYEAHPYMLVFDGKKTYLVEVFAAYVTSDQDHCYDIAISGAEDMAAFVDTAVRKSDIETGVEVGVSDKLVTLSTCAYVFEDARYIAIGRLVPIENE